MPATGRLVGVVEDEDTIRETVCLALRKEGYRTEAFDDGVNAWDAFARSLPDLGGDSEEAAERRRAFEALRRSEESFRTLMTNLSVGYKSGQKNSYRQTRR